MRKELLVQFQDLQFLSITCTHCKSELTIDCAQAGDFPQTCAVCRNSFGMKDLDTDILAFKGLYQAFKNTPNIGFRIAMKDGVP